jgi:hypothetical protein
LICRDVAISSLEVEWCSRLRLKLKSEVLAFLFGMFIILLNFGDDHTSPTVGNLDTIFGLRLWPLMDMIYPLATILIFLYYGKAKGKGELKFNAKTATLFIVFFLGLFLISIDDVSDVLRLGLILPETYWIAMMWLYPIISFLTFFSFGEANEKAT